MNGSNTLHNRGEQPRQAPELPPMHFAEIALDHLHLPPDLFDGRTPHEQTSPYANAFPLIVCATGATSFTVIDGCKRLLRMQRSGQVTAPCGILDTGIDSTRLGLLRIMLNKGRQLHLREKICFAGWLENNIAPDHAIEVCAGMGIAASERNVLKHLLSSGESAINAVSDGRIHIQSVEDFVVLSGEDRKAFLDTFGRLRLSVQMQRELLQWLPEIAVAENTTIGELLKRDTVCRILEDARINDPQKIQHIRELVHSWRFPRLHAARAEWESLAGSVNPDPRKIGFECSPAFEKDQLSIRIRLTDAGDAEALFSKLGQVPRHMWERLIYPCGPKNS
jgi:hypothetical protein